MRSQPPRRDQTRKLRQHFEARYRRAFGVKPERGHPKALELCIALAGGDLALVRRKITRTIEAAQIAGFTADLGSVYGRWFATC